MLKESRTTSKYLERVTKVIENLERQGFTDIQADIDDYETPPRLISKSKDINFVPDVMARKNGNKGYFEISKKVSDTNELVNKWTALSTLAEMKNGIFKIYVPHGHMKFTREILTDYNINAEVVKL